MGWSQGVWGTRHGWGTRITVPLLPSGLQASPSLPAVPHGSVHAHGTAQSPRGALARCQHQDTQGWALPLPAHPQLCLLPPPRTQNPLGGQPGGLHTHPASSVPCCRCQAPCAPRLSRDGWTRSSAIAVLISRVIKKLLPLHRSRGASATAARAGGSGGAVRQQTWHFINKLGLFTRIPRAGVGPSSRHSGGTRG